MTKEELKEKLKGAMYAQRTLEGELDKLQELRCIAQKVTPAYSQSPGGGSGNAQKLENSIAKIIEQEKIIAECCNELCSQLAEVRALVALLPMGPMRLVMQRRYFDIVNIGLHFFHKDVRLMLPLVVKHSIVAA